MLHMYTVLYLWPLKMCIFIHFTYKISCLQVLSVWSIIIERIIMVCPTNINKSTHVVGITWGCFCKNVEVLRIWARKNAFNASSKHCKIFGETVQGKLGQLLLWVSQWIWGLLSFFLFYRNTHTYCVTNDDIILQVFLFVCSDTNINTLSSFT